MFVSNMGSGAEKVKDIFVSNMRSGAEKVKIYFSQI